MISLKTTLGYLKHFQRYVGWKMYLVCGVVLLTGLFEGVGVALLVPILNVSGGGPLPGVFGDLVARHLNFGPHVPVLIILLVILFLAVSLKGILFFLQGIATARLTAELAKTLRHSLCDQYMGIRYARFVGLENGFLNNIVTTEVGRATFGFAKFMEVLVQVIFVVVYTVFIFILNWRAAVLVYIAFGCLVMALRSLSRVTQRLSGQVTEKNADLQQWLMQFFYNFKYLKATVRFGKVRERLFGAIDVNQDLQCRDQSIRFIPTAILEPFAVLFLSGLILYQVQVCGQSMGEVVVLLIFFYKSFQRLFGIRSEWQNFLSYVGALNVIQDVLASLRKEQEPEGAIPAGPLTTAIEFKDVHLSYGDKVVLSGVTLSIPRNSTVGIVGESGAGKTTVFDILCGLISPDQGAVLYDGVPYAELSLKSLRSRLGYVTQEPALFNDTVANNICFWETFQDDEGQVQARIEKAARLAHCDGFIKQMPDGYQTVVGDRGVKLSVGQRQRISIARELFRDPEIILFDEATSALDTESEMLIQESLETLIGQRTVVIVAHRLSTLRRCDYIYVLANGQVIEHGSFNALYHDETSAFHKMCKLQNI